MKEFNLLLEDYNNGENKGFVIGVPLDQEEPPAIVAVGDSHWVQVDAQTADDKLWYIYERTPVLRIEP